MYVCVCMGGGSGTSWHFIPLTGLSELDARGMLLKRQGGGCPTLTPLRPFTFFHYTQATREGSRYFTLSKHLILAALGFMPPPPLVMLSRASFVASHIPPPQSPQSVRDLCTGRYQWNVCRLSFIIARPFSCLPPCK